MRMFRFPSLERKADAIILGGIFLAWSVFIIGIIASFSIGLYWLYNHVSIVIR